MAFAKALHPDRRTMAQTTDVLGFVERASPDPERQNVTILFTDALESADPKLNLETSRLSALNGAHVIEELATRRMWSRTALRGEVHVVLPDAPKAPNCNSARELQVFYSALVKQLGGNLVAFNTYLTL